MNRKFITVLLLPALLLLVAACDDGRIYESTAAGREGVVVKLTGVLSGTQNWPSKYHLSLAGFDDESAYAVIAKELPEPADDGTVTMVLSGVTDDVTSIRLCALDQLRRLAVTFSEHVVTESTADTIYMNVGALDVSMFGAIQQSVFNTTCVTCHQSLGSGQAAAGLYLSEGKSYAALVDQPSTKVEGKSLVEPGNAAESVLHMALATDTTSTWRYNHSSLVVSEQLLALIDNWISNGALEN